MDDQALLEFHRSLVATPSVSGDEAAAAALVADTLAARGWPSTRVENNLYAVAGSTGPVLCLSTHLDTVPASPRWTRNPYDVSVVDGKVYGLGSNDAKASAAAMTAAFLRVAPEADALGVRVMLAFTAEEETRCEGSERLVGALGAVGLTPSVVIVGEPTGLDVSIAQKGLLVLELVAKGDACHAAHGRALGARNAIHALARDLVALEGVDLGGDHPSLGPVTAEPTVVQAGTARNMVPGEARCVIDVRVNPSPPPGAIAARIAAAIEGEVRVLSDRLIPCEIDADHPLVKAALAARPGAKVLGTRGVSDLVFWSRAAPGIKVGPGRTERSHTPDEYVLESEILDGVAFYEATLRALAAAGPLHRSRTSTEQ